MLAKFDCDNVSVYEKMHRDWRDALPTSLAIDKHPRILFGRPFFDMQGGSPVAVPGIVEMDVSLYGDGEEIQGLIAKLHSAYNKGWRILDTYFPDINDVPRKQPGDFETGWVLCLREDARYYDAAKSAIERVRNDGTEAFNKLMAESQKKDFEIENLKQMLADAQAKLDKGVKPNAKPV